MIAKPDRIRLGIYLAGPLGQSGPARYLRGILKQLDRREFDVTMFYEASGLQVREFDAKFVPLPMRKGCGAGIVEGADAPISSVRSFPPGLPHLRSGFAYSARLLPRPVKIWAGFAKEVFRLAHTFGSCNIDLLHTNETGCEESAVAARVAGISKVVGTFHVDSRYDLSKTRSGPEYRLLEHVSNHCLTKGIGVSHRTSEDWIRRTHLREGRVVTIHNGIDPERFRRRVDQATARRKFGEIATSDIVIAGVGRLDCAKGFAHLIEAMGLLSRQFPNVRMMIAGTGPLEPNLKRAAQRLGISDRVLLLGHCADIGSIYEAADIFVLSSLCEALPYALLEAMAYELPAIGTTVGGVPEVIAPGRTGYLVAPCDPGAIAAALVPLLRSRDLRGRFGVAGRDRVVRYFNEADCVRKTIQLYRDVLNAAGAAGQGRARR